MLAALLHRSDLDSTLVDAAREGDARAFDALVYRYQGALRRYVEARLECAPECEEVIQEVFVTAWRELPLFRRQVRFRTWLFGIAIVHCSEVARRQQRLRRLLGLPLLPNAPNRGSRPQRAGSEISLASADRETVRFELGELPELERHVLQLYYYADLTPSEIASLLGVEVGVIHQRFRDGHIMLRNRLRSEQKEPLPLEVPTP